MKRGNSHGGGDLIIMKMWLVACVIEGSPSSQPKTTRDITKVI